MSPGLLGLLAALAVLVLPLAAPARRAPQPTAPVATHRRVPARALAATAAGAGTAVLLGGAAGVLAGAVVLTVTWYAVPRFETASRRRLREDLERQAPLVVDLVAACLASGASVESSVAATARAVGAPCAELLERAVASARLGAEPAEAWREVAAHDALAGLARAVVRAHDTGAPLADLLPRIAERARAARRARVEAQVRTAAVRLTAPLGLAFLPAFVLLGVVPVVAAWVATVL